MDEEKFHDNDGNIYEIETRGERDAEKIYFSVKDFAAAFELSRLTETLINPKSKYDRGLDYQCFHINRLIINEGKSGRNLFLTYQGALRVLFCSRNKPANKFRKWATRTLFTAQLGTREQKETLSAGLLGVPIKSLKQVLNKSTSSVPCVYIFTLSLAKDLREHMNIPADVPDNHMIAKFGLTEDLKRRSGEHVKKYEKIKNAKVELFKYCYIDPKYLSDAEVYIKKYFNDDEVNINYENNKELVSINPKNKSHLNRMFELIKQRYSGCINDLIHQNLDL